MYLAWAIGVLALAGYALVQASWQAMLVSFVASALFAAGMVVWATLMQTLVPRDMLGRVSSIDWLVSLRLAPMGFALVGPLADLFGVEATLIGAGALAAVTTFAFLALPGLREPERAPGATSGGTRPARSA